LLIRKQNPSSSCDVLTFEFA